MARLKHFLGRVFPAWVFLFCLVSLPQPLQAADRTKVRVAIFLGNPPYEYLSPSGQPDGFTLDLLKALAEVANLEFELRPTPFADFIPALERGEVDLLTSMVWSEERARSIEFTAPVAIYPLIILARAGARDLRSEADLKGRKTLVLARSVMKRYFETGGLPYIEAPSHEASIQGLLEGRADCAVVPKYMWLSYAKTHGIKGLEPVPGDFYPTKRNFAVRKGDAAILNRINDGLFTLQTNGTLQKIHEHHLGALETSDIPFHKALRRTLPTMLLIVSGLGLVLLVAWVLMLRRTVRERTVELQRTVENLQAALSEVRQLSGLIPICSHCKKIRDDKGYWQAVESYISQHSEATFSHGLCPDCVHDYFPGFQPKEGGA